MELIKNDNSPKQPDECLKSSKTQRYHTDDSNISILKSTSQLVAGMGQANAFIWSVPFTITFGVTSVLETLVSQAYGSKQYTLCGTYLNR